jgi:hypothetical protein|tara:strand:+ start:71 stop:529 length:459 start_codon:yes stop_codon:yes gene_type:complete
MQSLDKVKIGYTSNNAIERKRQLETGNPHGIVIIGTVQGTQEHEKKIHKSLEKYNIQGEWFEDCQEIRNYIAQMLNNKKVIKYKQRTWENGDVTISTSEPQWMNQFNKCEQVNADKIKKLIKSIREVEIKINQLIGKKKILDKEYIKLIKGS